MKALVARALPLIVVAGMLAAACTAAGPSPVPTTAAVAPTRAAEPTRAPAPAPTKAAEPTRAPAPQPTAAPATKLDYPQKGRSISFSVAWAAGGPVDVHARLLAPLLEKELGVPVQVVNKVGGGGQVGTTEVALAKPDGYTMGMASLWGSLTTYVDPERKAAFGRKDIQPVANQVLDPNAIGVRADSPLKTLKDLIDAAKANPEKIKVGDAGILTTTHLSVLLFEKQAGVKFSQVHFDGSAPATTALLGGHVDVVFGNVSNYPDQFKSGSIRLLGIMDNEQSKFFPGVKTLEEQGLKIYFGSSRGVIMPGGTPRGIVDLLASAIKKTGEDRELVAKMESMGGKMAYMDTIRYSAYWDELESQATELIKLAKQ